MPDDRGQAPVTLLLEFPGTEWTPPVSIEYFVDHVDAAPRAIVRCDGGESQTVASNHIYELAFRYRDKGVGRATVRTRDRVWVDANGDGRIESHDGAPAVENVTVLECLESILEPGSPRREPRAQELSSLVPELTGARAIESAFRATCGALAAHVHRLRSHSLLWASIAPGLPPNDVHRHLGGNVYCLFYQGVGEFHRVVPERGFETLEIEVNDSNPFHCIPIARHFWYQPINTGHRPLLYFMVNEPGYENSETLVLSKANCPPEWRFAF